MSEVLLLDDRRQSIHENYFREPISIICPELFFYTSGTVCEAISTIDEQIRVQNIDIRYRVYGGLLIEG
jgi:hypothetical protein